MRERKGGYEGGDDGKLAIGRGWEEIRKGRCRGESDLSSWIDWEAASAEGEVTD